MSIVGGPRFGPAGEKEGHDGKRGCPIGRTKGGQNTRLHAVTDAKGGPMRSFMSAPPFGEAGHRLPGNGSATMSVRRRPRGSLSAAEWLIAGRGHDTVWIRVALKGKGIRPVQG